MTYRLVAAMVLASSLPASAEELTIHADTTLHRRASRDSATVVSLAAGDTVELIASGTGWLEVRARGHTGWIPDEAMVEVLPPDESEPAPVVGLAEATDEGEDADTGDADDEPSPADPRERALDVHVAAGLAVITQGFRTAGGTVRDNYNIGVTAAAVALTGKYTYRWRDEIVVGAELALAYHKALPGVRSTGADGEVVTTGVAIRDIGVRLIAGYELRRLQITARLGVRHHLFAVAGVQDPIANPTRMPSEIQLSPTIGAGLAIPRVTAKLALAFALDSFLVGTRTKQTPGQEDGTRARARGVTLRSALAYRWRPNLDLRFAHEVTIGATAFGAPDPMSARLHDGTAVARFDVVHRLTIGVAKGF